MRVEVVYDAGINDRVFTIDHSTGTTRIRGFALGTAASGSGAGVWVAGGSGHHIACNHLSRNAAGSGALGSGSFSSGITVTPQADGVTIGTNGDGVDDIGERNVFGPGPTIAVNTIASINNVIAGNYFGLSPDGTTRIGAGVLGLVENADGTRVGTNEDGVSDELERNYFTGNTNVQVFTGPYDADDVRIVGNTFGMTTLGGQATSNLAIKVDGLPASTTGFEIRGNTFGWVETGIELDVNGGEVLVSDNTFGGEHKGAKYGSIVAIRAGRSAAYTIRDNLIQNSEMLGIVVEDDATLAAGSRDNCLVGNFFGLSNFTGVAIAFEHNWWGDISGPSQGGPGTGDAVSLLVDYEPWLTSPPRQCNTAPVAVDANFTVAEDAAVGTVLGTGIGRPRST